LIAASKTPATAAEAQYWLGRIYDYKGNKAENAFPGFHEEIAYRPRAEAAFKAAGTPKPEWVAEADAAENAVKAADAAIARLQADDDASAADMRSAIEVRIKLRPDPIAYSTGANLMLARRAAQPFVLRLAAEGRIAGERFIGENESSYRLAGKVQGSLDRNAAAFADIAGWALFLQNDMKGAETRLAEAARLSRNNDTTNQLHLGQLSRTKDDLRTARDHYINVLTLAAATPAQREAATTALRDVQAKSGDNPMEFDNWLAATLESKKEERREAASKTMVGRKLPGVSFTDLSGKKVDLLAERGNVVLLNFFAAW
jgi:hypothetical protein